jgi:hypothetical protein
MIDYLRFLRDKASDPNLSDGLLKAWYRFPEVKQNWFGFSVDGNRGSGLGRDFASALHTNLHRIFKDFGEENVTHGSHLEKLCLIGDGVGKDNISDFTTNLILGYLLEYTEAFAARHISEGLRRTFTVDKVRFNYDTETWERADFDLPQFRNDFVLLTPRDMLTKDDTWINRSDLVDEFPYLLDAIPNDQLREQINNYFRKLLPKNAKRKEEREAAARTIRQFPQLVDYYIRSKEETGEDAAKTSLAKVRGSKQLYVEQFKQLPELLASLTEFYRLPGNTYDEARRRVEFLKDVIENKGGHKIFYVKGRPVEREEDVHILYRMAWFATPSDVSREVNDGRGPADFKISRGSRDKSLVEFKLAKNTRLRDNLQKQTKIYEKASDAKRSIKVILFFSLQERQRVEKILAELDLAQDESIVLIDARRDNKPSGSKA